MQCTSTTESVAKIERCTRVSFECHTDLLFDLDDELLNEFNGKGEAPEDVFPEDDALDALFQLLRR